MARLGFKGFDRHQIALTDRMPDGRDVLRLMSCKLDDPTNNAVVIDFGVGAIWNIEGETVIFQTDSKKVELPMNSDGEFFVMGGGPAITAVLPVVSTTKGKRQAETVQRV